MKQGDFVKIDYVGRIKSTGTIFDLTKKEVAKEENIYNPNGNYSPVVLIIGSGYIIEGLDEELRKMKVGDKKKIEIPPEKAFGPKKDEMIRLMPESVFKEQNLNVTPGYIVSMGNLKGKVLSVEGGRVRVDFNHPLAGQVIEYDLEVIGTVDDPKEQIKSVVDYFAKIDGIEADVKKKVAEITVRKDVDVIRPVKKIIADTVMKWCDVKEVKWTEVFSETEKEKTGENTTEK